VISNWWRATELSLSKVECGAPKRIAKRKKYLDVFEALQVKGLLSPKLNK